MTTTLEVGRSVICKDAQTELDTLCDQQLTKIAEWVRFMKSVTPLLTCTFFISVLLCFAMFPFLSVSYFIYDINNY